RCAVLREGLKPLRCVVAQITPAKCVGSLAKKFNTAERSTTQRVYMAGPAALYTGERISHVFDQPIAVQLAELRTGGTRHSDAWSAVTPLARPQPSLITAEIRPVAPLRIITCIFERDASPRRACEFVAPGCGGQ